MKDLIFKLKKNIDWQIRNHIKKNQPISKLQYLPFSFNDLKNHLEVQFEPWMNWNNYGRYHYNEWDDDNKKTWTWQIDHIIPHSNFEYKSVRNRNFIKCWQLSNLRPYSAKLNVLNRN